LVADLLSEYFLQASTSTTIFIYHSGSVNSHTYKEHSYKQHSCPQRTFLSKEGFALLDLSAQAFSIRSTDTSNDHIISEIEFPFLETKKNSNDARTRTSLHDLATLIYRSGESVVPFPIFSSDMALLG
jgi:hypothetical protein